MSKTKTKGAAQLTKLDARAIKMYLHSLIADLAEVREHTKGLPPAQRLTDYDALLASHAPRPIRTKAEYNRLLKIVKNYTRPDLTKDERQFLDLVSGLVEKYEEEHFPIPDASPGDVILFLLDAHGLSQSEFARQLGLSRQFITHLVKGRRSLTGEQIRKFADFFGVSPTVFVPRA